MVWCRLLRKLGFSMSYKVVFFSIAAKSCTVTMFFLILIILTYCNLHTTVLPAMKFPYAGESQGRKMRVATSRLSSTRQICAANSFMQNFYFASVHNSRFTRKVQCFKKTSQMHYSMFKLCCECNCFRVWSFFVCKLLKSTEISLQHSFWRIIIQNLFNTKLLSRDNPQNKNPEIL